MAIKNFIQLTVVFGEQWIIKNFLPHLFALQTEICYLHRLTPLFGILALSEVVSAEIVKKYFVPVLI